MQKSTSPRRGFTLIELLVVIAIIAILIGLLLPAVQKVREAASRMSCSNNMKNLGLAIHNYQDTNGGLPPGGINAGANIESWGWGALILPFIEQQNLYNQLGVNRQRLHDFIVANRDTTNISLLQSPISTFVCPSDTGGRLMTGPRLNGGSGRHFAGAGGLPNNFRVAKSNYVGVAGSGNVADPTNDGVLARGELGITIQSIEDGSSNTFLIGERDQFCHQGAWVGNRNPTGGGPQGIDYTLGAVFRELNLPNNGNHQCIEGFSSRHTGGANFLLCDGSVQFINDNIGFNMGGMNRNSNNQNYVSLSLGTYQRLGIRNDGVPVTLP